MSSLKRTSLRASGILLCMALAVPLFALEASGDEPVTAPVKIGKLSRYPKDVAKKYGIKDFKQALDSQGPQGSLIGNPKLDVAYQIWTFSPEYPNLGGKTVIAERDLETLSLKRSILIPHLVFRAVASTGAEFAHTLDTRNDRLILEYGHYTVSPALLFGIIVLDLETFTFNAKEFPRGFVRNAQKNQSVFGMEYDEVADELIVLAAGMDNLPAAGAIANALTLVGWKGADLSAAGPLPGPPGMMGPRYLRNCRRDPINPVPSPALSPIMIAEGPDLDQAVADPTVKRWVVFPCYSTPFSVNDVLIRISRDNLFNPSSTEEKAIPAPAAIANWTMDAKRGRMYLLNATQEVDAWVYEVASNAFIGLIEMTPKGDTSAAAVGLGVDEVSGRLYGFGFGFGIMITEADQDPVPQADTYDAGGPKVAGEATILVDPRRNRIIFVRGAGGPESWLENYEMWKVPPPLPPQPPEDSDLLTVQVQEAEGKTTAEYGGVASAYGARMLLAGGVAGVPPSNGNDQLGSLYANANLRCGARSREIGLGLVPATQLSQSIVDAHAESIHLDDNTIKDFGQPSRCDAYYQYAGPIPQIPQLQLLRDNVFFTSLFGRMQSLRDGTGLDAQMRALGVDEALESLTGIDSSKTFAEQFNATVAPHSGWSYTPAYCAAPHYPNDKPGQNSERFVGETYVDCKKDNDVRAHAEGHATGVLGAPGEGLPIRIGKATSSTRVFLDPKDGLVSEATARVENVQIGDVTIGFIENTARSFAHGRSGTAKTDEYEPTIGMVRGGGITGCEIRCNIDELMPQLNNALSGRAEIRRTKPEGRLQLGSKGGYEAGIIKSDKQQASDNALTGDDSREVAALEVIIYNDNPVMGRARQLVQLAGVRTTSNYGIKLLFEGTPCGVECEPPAAPVPPPTAPGPQVVVVEKQLPGRVVTRRVPVYLGVPGGFRLLFADARSAGAMATVWLLLLSPGIAYLRRRRLRSLT